MLQPTPNASPVPKTRLSRGSRDPTTGTLKVVVVLASRRVVRTSWEPLLNRDTYTVRLLRTTSKFAFAAYTDAMSVFLGPTRQRYTLEMR